MTHLKLRKITALLALATCLVTLSACVHNRISVRPRKSNISKAAHAAHDISIGLRAAETSLETSYSAKLVTTEEARQVAFLINDATLANDTFIMQVKAASKDTTAADINLWFSRVSMSIAQLQSQGVLKVRDAKAQQNLQLTLQTVNAAVALIQAMPTTGGN